jgi:hypothetical protein
MHRVPILEAIKEHLATFKEEFHDDVLLFIEHLEEKFAGAFEGEKKAVVAPAAPLGPQIISSMQRAVVAPPPLKENGDMPDLEPGVQYDFSLRPEVAAKMGLSAAPIAPITADAVVEAIPAEKEVNPRPEGKAPESDNQSQIETTIAEA